MTACVSLLYVIISLSGIWHSLLKKCGITEIIIRHKYFP